VPSDNPAAGVNPPLRGKRKEKQYLYPSEFLKFLLCPEVPRDWKISAALALYSYGRDGEIARLDWRDVDLEHGVLRITRARDRDTGATKSTKTGATRRFSVEPNLLPLLRAMHANADGKGRVFEHDATHLSRTFRRWLLVAGINRHELHATTATSRAVTWHDLRASAATWMAVRGDKPLAIRQRCGHSSFTTTELYIREAEVLAEGFGEVFPELPANCHPIAIGRMSLAIAAKKRIFMSGTRVSKPKTILRDRLENRRRRHRCPILNRPGSRPFATVGDRWRPTGGRFWRQQSSD
jgi:integrase